MCSRERGPRDEAKFWTDPMRLIALLFAASLVIAAQAADEYSVPRTLVLAQTLSIKDSHSRFLRFLEASGREVDVREVSDDTLRLRDWDIWLYNEIIVLAPEADGGHPRDVLQAQRHLLALVGKIEDTHLAIMQISAAPSTTQPWQSSWTPGTASCLR